MKERIVESNIRRTFTVRFPNLYCVWQRCRDIRGSYRNVLLLIVLHPEGSRRPRTKGSGVPNGDGKSGKRDDSRGRETEDSYIGRRAGERRAGGRRAAYSRKGEKEGKCRLGMRERERRERIEKGASERQRKRGRERERSGNTACTGAFDRPMN